MDSEIGCQVEVQEISLNIFYAWWPQNDDMPFALYGMCLQIFRPGEKDALETFVILGPSQKVMTFESLANN